VNLTVGAWVLPDLVGRGPAMDLVLTGRWLEAAEALALGLLNHLSPEPDALANEIAADLARRGVAAGIKPVMAAGGLPDRLEAERAANRSAWAQLNAPVPQVSRPVPSPAAGEP
jgi:enoyl-CoA hydratase/carnithine racemase